MPEYSDIDDLLLTTNKGLLWTGAAPGDGPDIPRPGESVMVSFVSRGLKEVLVHYMDPNSRTCRGETRGSVFDGSGHEILRRGEYVQFSDRKIAGIHR